LILFILKKFLKTTNKFNKAEYNRIILRIMEKVEVKNTCGIMEKLLDNAEVIIIGAGISGISCAKHLSEQGISSIILEARNRIGGRIYTYDSLGVKVDVGATFIHGASKENPIYNLFKKYSLKNHKFDGSTHFQVYQDGKSLDKYLTFDIKEQVDSAFAYVMRNIEILRDNIRTDPKFSHMRNFSIEDGVQYILENNLKYKKNWKEDSIYQHFWNYKQWVYEEFEGIDFCQQSLASFGLDEQISGGNIGFEDGYISLINELSKGLDIRKEHIVESIEGYNSDSNIITISTNKGQFQCKNVVCTIPLGVLKTCSIKFIPQLPEYKLNSINNLGMGLMNKVVLHFPTFFWKKSMYRIQHISSNKGEFPWFDNYSTKKPILYGWLACSSAEEYEKLSDEEIVEKSMVILRNIYGEKNVPKPIDYFITRWNSDPFSLGSWSGK
jgi:monoamine oxidase